jgi:N6-L-threonylcarbamoyladenine synthase
MAGHLYSPLGNEIKNSKFKIKNLFPQISLIVSGGHTMLVLMKDPKTYRVLGQTVDDAAGEAFDKVARLLNLPYPGGPEVSKCAAQGNSSAIAFPRPMLRENNFNYKYITDCFQSIDTDSLNLEFNGLNRPLVIRGVNDKSFLYLVMPINK